MQIFIKLYGELKGHAPGDQSQFALRLEPGTRLDDIQRLLAVSPDRHIALINGRRSTGDATFADGDTLVLMPPISGG
ncbi:MAG: MoaD/ThiS family protein [Desulfobacteraceae bacterium]|jgi:molybdopterin converting factor small subunit|nr:MoaD/ThiS family protein [Desulfobacteraceae bacterium]